MSFFHEIKYAAGVPVAVSKYINGVLFHSVKFMNAGVMEFNLFKISKQLEIMV